MLAPRLSFVIAALLATSEASRVQTRGSASAAYTAFRSKFPESRAHEPIERYHERLALFQTRSDEVRRHNAQPGITWTASVNKFADYYPAEFQALLGHRPAARASNRARAGASLMQVQSPQAGAEEVAQSVDWGSTLNSSAHPKDQGGCGSCWAVAAAGALETHLEIAGVKDVEVSYEQLVDCTPNPDECGGSGGCNGATSELALEYVHLHGIDAKADYTGYQSGGAGTCTAPKNPVLSTSGFVRLPENELQPLLAAVSAGPVVVSADAGKWGMYSNGVFDGCSKDAVINHAILAMGYGTDKELKRSYWLIRNSWGDDWGEHGYIRLLRHSGEGEEGNFCGTDSKPLDGVGCKGGPAELPVCGMCGVLSDSAYPIGVAAGEAKQPTEEVAEEVPENAVEAGKKQYA